MDVSELFQNIIMVSNTQDLILKKMIYLYLGHYSKSNERMALLAVNSIIKDTHDDSPMIRGMAIRWLSSLSTPSLAEHMLNPVKTGLIDVSAYVRRNAALACGKVYRLNNDLIGRDQGIINKLYELIRDRDPLVVINSLCALEEILSNEGGVALNQPIMIHLVTHLTEFNSWGQSKVLRLLSRYQINDEEELFGLMNALDTYFQNSNTAVVLSTINCFLTFTQTRSDVHNHVYIRLKTPLLSSLVGAGPELSYVVLSHLLLITKRLPSLFSAEYKQFFVKWKDPLYLRLLKVKVLLAVANEINSKDIVNELSAYVLEDPPEFSRASIRAIGRLAMSIPSVSELSLEVLLSFLELEQLKHVMATTLVALKDMIRRFPQIAHDVIPRLAHSLDVIEDSNAVTAIITMIGEYGDIISDGPYILEEVINSWDNKDDKVRNQLLVSTLKLFFKRPKEVKPILGKLFKVSTEDALHPDVHDRALFFYRLMSDPNNIEKCKQILTSGMYVDQFVEESDGVEVDALFEEFDSLSVIYGEGSNRFLKGASTAAFEDNQDEEAIRKQEEEDEYYRKQEELRRAQYDESEEQRPATYHAPFSQPAPPQSMQFSPSILLDPQNFERTWKSLTVARKHQSPYQGSTSDVQQIDQFFSSQNIKSVAKGAAGGSLKFFFYCQETQNSVLFLVELVINLSNKQVAANIKTTNEQYAEQFEAALQRLLQQI
eukprot:TRINITY_DN6765_c0_g2_i1.p1 TRINITY_DN6765_c0_g2~~TRINITY_DN6765_c0_g2_i1.p1  ORF type:complete len:808 (-),score=171.22 TRINITY_DN6765_c0_g2_i1:82-2223(-)